MAAPPAPSDLIVILVDINGTLGLKCDGTRIAGTALKPADLTRTKSLYCRPGCVEFIQGLHDHSRCKVGIYTCWQHQNADAAVSALGIRPHVFYTYTQVTDPRFAWIAEDRTRYNPKKRMYEWKKDVAKLLPHVSKEVGQTVTLANIILVDDTPDKTQECSRNVVLPPPFDEAAVRRNHSATLPALGAYLKELLDNCRGDVRDYLAAHPFDEAEYLAAGLGKLTLSAPSCPRHVDPSDRAGDHGSTVQTLHSSQFRLWYDQHKVVELADLQAAVPSLLGLRLGRFLGALPDLTSAAKAIQLWSSERNVVYTPKRGDTFIGKPQTAPFYRFLNHELRFDAHDAMPDVAIVVRVFNQLLAQPFKPRRPVVFRGTAMPSERIQAFFSEEHLGKHGGYLRIPAFFAASYAPRVADSFKSLARDGNVPVVYEIRLPDVMHHARDISDVSEMMGEQEVLFPPYSLFRFLSREAVGHGFRVVLQAAADNKGGHENVPCPMWQ